MPYKNYSQKQKKLAAVKPPRKKITGADLKALKKKGPAKPKKPTKKPVKKKAPYMRKKK